MKKSLILTAFLISVFSFFQLQTFALYNGENYKLNGDLRIREVFFKNIIDLDDNNDDKYNFFRIRLRLYGEYKPSENLKFYTRITGEPRYYIDPDFDDDTKNEEFIFDNLYVQYTAGDDIKYITTIGRQDFDLGSRIFIFDGTPLDGSRTRYVDALKEVINFDNYSITLFASRVKRDDPLPKINDKDMILIEGNQNTYGIFANGKIYNGLSAEAYYYYHKIDDFDLKTHTIGSRIIKNFTEEIKASLEFACQFGDYEDKDVSDAYVSELTLKYTPKGLSWKPEAGFSFTYISGDDPDTEDYEGIDLIYGRWPRLSELYIYTCIRENRVSLTDNLQKYTLSMQLKPKSNITFFTSASYLRANENADPNNSFLGKGKERGLLFKAKTLFKITKSLSGHLWYEYLKPKNYYSSENRDNAYFFRYELMYKF